ncbi:hypothetical protein M3616_13070 [Bacillus velezensis]|uniref:hypothetical protein n=1 Tax=Bacillus velezensis TaxID=492670 RepID=UPI0013155D6F|nr:hypothetical protein [Bacillus velezensis]MCM3276295.1 hypothetical protein [Bacillus velezensis]MCM3350155.1 hypothetical protein [Bacillus velezensis]MEC1898452.1 hypothetical protein [Bacillus velezensis]MEC1919026.1 hypothetical protein [Bacillus velezensis]URD65231.1 hypothetical protein M8X21_04770 [Bacillus velezensis]
MADITRKDLIALTERFLDECPTKREKRELDDLARAELTMPNFSTKSSRQVFAKYVRKR